MVIFVFFIIIVAIIAMNVSISFMRTAAAESNERTERVETIRYLFVKNDKGEIIQKISFTTEQWEEYNKKLPFEKYKEAMTELGKLKSGNGFTKLADLSESPYNSGYMVSVHDGYTVSTIESAYLATFATYLINEDGTCCIGAWVNEYENIDCDISKNFQDYNEACRVALTPNDLKGVQKGIFDVSEGTTLWRDNEDGYTWNEHQFEDAHKNDVVAACVCTIEIF